MKSIGVCILLVALVGVVSAQLQFDDDITHDIDGGEEIQVYVAEFETYDDIDDLQTDAIVAELLKGFDYERPVRFRRHQQTSMLDDEHKHHTAGGVHAHSNSQHLGKMIEARSSKHDSQSHHRR